MLNHLKYLRPQFCCFECRKRRIHNWFETLFINRICSEYFLKWVNGKSANDAHGWLGSWLDGCLGNRCWTSFIVAVSVNLSLEHWLMQLDLLPHQPHAEDVSCNLTKTNAHLHVKNTTIDHSINQETDITTHAWHHQSLNHLSCKHHCYNASQSTTHFLSPSTAKQN